MLSVTATRVFAYGEDSFALPLTSELGLTVVRSRSRENNTQLFSNTLAPLRYALYGENVNRIPCALRFGNPIQIHGERLQRKEKRHPDRDTEKSRLRVVTYAPLRTSRIVVCYRIGTLLSADSLLAGERVFRSPVVSTRRKNDT